MDVNFYFDLQGLSQVRTHRHWKKSSNAVDGLNEFKNISMPWLPLKFVSHGNLLMVPHGNESTQVSGLQDTLRKKLSSALQDFLEHFREEPIELRDNDWIKQIGNAQRQTLPSLQSLQEVSHSWACIALWLLLMYEKPEQAPHVGPKMNAEDDQRFVEKALEILGLRESDIPSRIQKHVRKIQKAQWSSFIDAHSVTALPSNAIPQTSFCTQQASNRDLLERVQEQYTKLIVPLTDVSYAVPSVFYVDPTPMVQDQKVTCNVIVQTET